MRACVSSSKSFRSISAAARLFIIGILLISAGCRKKVAKVAPPPPPPPPNYLAIADTAYAARNFAGAVDAYQQFLKANALAPERDRALFRIAMAYYVKESPLYDAPRALNFLRQLTATLPESPYAAEAALYLSLHDELAAQQKAVAERSQRIEALEGELAALKTEDEKKAEELARVKTDTVKREERIKQVTAELERLKAIDMQRRPTKPMR